MRCEILYEDETIIVIRKPAGLATQSAKVGEADAVSELKKYLAENGAKNPYIGVVHRLDQPVEGLLVFAKTKDAAAGLTKQLSAGTLNKHYYALVCGNPSVDEGELVDYLIKEQSVARVVSPEHKDAKKAVLQYKVVKRMPEGLALLDIHIDTGRFHQIRVQMSHAGMPLLGDMKYGSDASMTFSREVGVRFVALYAYHLEFRHPITKKAMSYELQPESFRQ